MSWASVAGAVVGGGISLLGGKKGSTQQVADRSPWGPQQPHLTGIYGRAQAQSNQPGIAPWDPFSGQAYNMLGQQALDPNNLTSQAQAELGRTLSGQYLTPESNPYLAGMASKISGDVRANVSGAFGGENYGGSANQEWLADKTAENLIPLYAGNYNRERGYMQSGLSMAPGLQTANIDQLGRAGAMGDARAAQETQAPWEQLQNYNQLVTGNQGGTTTQTNPYFYNPWSSMFGGAAAGAQVGREIYDTWGQRGGGGGGGGGYGPASGSPFTNPSMGYGGGTPYGTPFG